MASQLIRAAQKAKAKRVLDRHWWNKDRACCGCGHRCDRGESEWQEHVTSILFGGTGL